MTGDSAAGGSEDTKALRRHWRLAPFAILLAGLLLCYSFGWQDYLSLQHLGDSRNVLKAFVADNPVLAPAGFILIYAIAMSFAFPAPSILTALGGLLFGWPTGAAIAVVAKTAGAATLFLAARSAFGGFLEKRTAGHAARLARGFKADAFGYLLVLRIAPFIPSVAVSIAPALFNVRFRTFLAATLIGNLPAALSYAWLGRGLDSIFLAAEATGREATLSDLITPELTLAFAVLALVAGLATVVGRAWQRRERMEPTDKQPASAAGDFE